MNRIDLLERTLAEVVERVGDPAPRVYERLFEQSPDLRAMFVNDPLGSVRGEMFLRALEAMIDAAAGRPYAGGMVACEWRNHGMLGVTQAQFNGFFDAMVEVFRQSLGPAWTADIDQAWQDALQAVRGFTEPQHAAAAQL